MDAYQVEHPNRCHVSAVSDVDQSVIWLDTDLRRTGLRFHLVDDHVPLTALAKYIHGST